ncbi:MAG TPA: hypothetical protein VNI20_11870 [Fimbriimonadaceae bacterium]|nr:hypothetical protein [Fimbriimonadaceae bacterium]
MAVALVIAWRIVLPSIDLDAQFRLVTIEIQRVGTERHLSLEMEANAVRPEFMPNPLLRLGHRAPEPLCVVRLRLGRSGEF